MNGDIPEDTLYLIFSIYPISLCPSWIAAISYGSLCVSTKTVTRLAYTHSSLYPLLCVCDSHTPEVHTGCVVLQETTKSFFYGRKMSVGLSSWGRVSLLYILLTSSPHSSSTPPTGCSALTGTYSIKSIYKYIEYHLKTSPAFHRMPNWSKYDVHKTSLICRSIQSLSHAWPHDLCYWYDGVLDVC